ncbi:MAG TPA: sensor histidine kinase [Iamia sp.]|nr:sensor histidine kinase [Iamia sp.]
MAAESALDGRARVVDRVAFGVVLVLLGAVTLTGATGSGARDVDFGAIWLLALAAGLAVVGRRIPATAALANLGLTVWWHQLGYASAAITVPYLVSFYLLGNHGDRLKELLVGGIAVGATSVAILTAAGESAGELAAAVGWPLAALLLGELSHHRRMLLAEHEERARRAVADAERDAEQRIARHQVAMAHDLHDVLAHTIAVVTVQAAAGREALERGEEAAAAAALDVIRQAGREASGEVRALISVLRDGSTPPTTTPAPGLERIPDLAGPTRAAGVEVDLELDPGQASDVVELTAYRVVQESLTNVVRHSGAERATVTVARRGPHLVVEVVDDGPGAGTAAEGTGFGLRGMRERVEALGGTLRAGPEAGGGWRVRASLPHDDGCPR